MQYIRIVNLITMALWLVAGTFSAIKNARHMLGAPAYISPYTPHEILSTNLNMFFVFFVFPAAIYFLANLALLKNKLGRTAHIILSIFSIITFPFLIAFTINYNMVLIIAFVVGLFAYGASIHKMCSLKLKSTS